MPVESHESSRRSALFALALVLVAFAAYSPVLRAGFIWDDDDYVENNLTLRTPDGLQRLWFDLDATPQYYPLVHTSFWLEYRLWGLDPTGYHVVNLLLHVAAALLLRRLLAKLGLPAAVAWGAAAVFVLHPVHVESVAWITERKNVLSTVFYLGAATAFLKSGPWIERARNRAPSPTWFALSLLLFACALLSKTVTASLPVALLLVIWWKRGKLERRDLLAVSPFLALGAAFGLLTLWLEKHHVGAVGDEWGLSPVERLLVAGRALWFYAGKLFRPARLTFIYPRWQIDSAVAWQYLFPLAAAAVAASLWFARRRIGRGPLTAALFFAVTLTPALGFFDVYPMRYSFVADHFQYLASIGPIVLITALVLRLAQPVAGRSGRAMAVLPAAALLVLAVMTWQQTHVYHDRETLWTDTLAKNPGAGMAHSNLAGVLDSQGRTDEALFHFREALRIVEESSFKVDYALAHNNVGFALLRTGEIQLAVQHLNRALEIDPGHARAHNNLGVVCESEGRLEEAIVHFRLALQRKPDYAKARTNFERVQAALTRKAARVARMPERSSEAS